MSESFDAIVIGAGHNGLTAACSLAGSGRRVAVVERRERIGGLAGGEPFHPGYRDPGLLHDSSGVRDWIVRDLELERHGLEWCPHPPDVHVSDPGGALLIAGQAQHVQESVAARSAKDATRLGEFRALIDSFAPAIRAFADHRSPNLADGPRPTEVLRLGLGLKRLGRRLMLELLRIPPMPLADWLDDWFETDALKAGLALPAVAGTFLGPRAPGSAANLLLRAGIAGSWVRGGGPALVDALAAAATERGVEIRTGRLVERVEVGGSGITGVVVDGETWVAPTVLASCDPRTLFLRLLPPSAVSAMLGQRIRGWRSRGVVARLRMALSRPLRLRSSSDRPFELVRTAADLDAIEKAFDAVKYGEISERPILEIWQPSEATGLAPAGAAVASVLVHCAPLEPRGGWTEDRRSELCERVLLELRRHISDLDASLVTSDLITPADIAQIYGCSGGHLEHGEATLDQILVRPTPECVGYATPVAGLWMCGSGSHPGGGLSGAPGWLAARAASLTR